jgi:hypothetical protein
MKLKTAILAYLFVAGVVGAASLWPDKKHDPVLAHFVRAYAASEITAPTDSGVRSAAEMAARIEFSKAKGE